MIRPMDSDVTALSSVVAEGHHASQFVSSTLSIHSLRRVFPSTVAVKATLTPPPLCSLFRLRLTRSLRSLLPSQRADRPTSVSGLMQPWFFVGTSSIAIHAWRRNSGPEARLTDRPEFCPTLPHAPT